MKSHAKYLLKQNCFVNNLFQQLVENFPHTYFVGGYVRDSLLGIVTNDIDIATSATPEQITLFLNKAKITFSTSGIRYGVIKVSSDKYSIEIATFRTERYGQSRYPTITYIKNPKADAKRRDFTINALYLQSKTGHLNDYYHGLKDLNKHRINFIGNSKFRIKEDPLRIVRALRFCLQLKFKMDIKTWSVITRNFYLIQTLTKKKIESEIKKTKSPKNIKLLKEMIFKKKPLDKVSKKFYYDFK